MTYLDTHVVVWLGGGEVGRLSPGASQAIENEDLGISPMVLLELGYLHEIDRLRIAPADLVDLLSRDIGLQVCSVPFSALVDEAMKDRWTRDPFDRLIVAQARLSGANLITRDLTIRKHYEKAVW